MQYTISYEGDLRTKAEHPDSGSVIYTDAPKDNQGKGEAFSPTDLFAVALASCAMTLMGMAAKKLHLDLKDARMQVEKSMALNPRRVGKIAIQFFCSIEVTDEQRLSLEKAALECPVHKSLNSELIVEYNFMWGN